MKDQTYLNATSWSPVDDILRKAEIAAHNQKTFKKFLDRKARKKGTK